jgi:hypothetical protein
MGKHVTFASIDSQLVKVHFESIKDEPPSNRKFSIKVDDRYKLEAFAGASFTVLYTRSVFLAPSALFKAEFSYELSFVLDEDSIEHFNNDRSRLEDFLKRRCVDILNEQDILSDISTLVSLLTKYGKYRPLLIAPQIKGDKSDD